MKYKKRVIRDFGIYVGTNKDIYNILHSKAKNWLSMERVLENLVVVYPKRNTVKCTNDLFDELFRVFDDVAIAVYYEDFENGYNVDEFKSKLDINLFEL